MFEVEESRGYPQHWHVESIQADGSVLVAVFSGPDAQKRADEYADWKNGVRRPASVLQIVSRSEEV